MEDGEITDCTWRRSPPAPMAVQAITVFAAWTGGGAWAGMAVGAEFGGPWRSEWVSCPCWEESVPGRPIGTRSLSRGTDRGGPRCMAAGQAGDAFSVRAGGRDGAACSRPARRRKIGSPAPDVSAALRPPAMSFPRKGRADGSARRPPPRLPITRRLGAARPRRGPALPSVDALGAFRAAQVKWKKQGPSKHTCA